MIDIHSAQIEYKRELILTGNINKLLFKFSMPAIVAMAVNALYNVVDTIFVGRGVGSVAIAALSIVLPLQLIMMALGLMIGVGSSSIICRALGRDRKGTAINTVGNAVIIGLILDAIFIAFAYAYLNKLLIFFGASSNVLPYAIDYSRIILFGIFFITFAISSSDIIRAEGNPRQGMIAMVIGAASNIVLDPILIFGFKMGVKGAAIATVISQVLSSVYIIFHFMSKRSIYRISREMFKIKFGIMKEILSIGFPSFIRQGSASIIILIFNKVLVYYGNDLYIAIMGVGLRLLSLIQMPLIGIAQGFSTIVGFNYGAKFYQRVKKILYSAVGWTAVIGGVGFIIMMLFPAAVISIFSNDIEFISNGIFPLRVVIIFLPLIGIQILGGGLFQSIGKVVPALVITISRQILFLIPAVILLPIFFGVDGVWIAVPVADFLSLIVTGIWIYKEVGVFNRLALSQTGSSGS